MIKIPTSRTVFGTKNASDEIQKLKLSDHIAFSMKKGLKCKIMNGNICDVNGVPFANKNLQDSISFFTERVSNSKLIVLATIVPSGTISYSFSDIAEIENAANSNAARHSEFIKNYSIEIYDFLFELEPESISYGTKRMMMYGMSKSALNDGFIYLAPAIFGDNMTNESLMSFIMSNIYSAKNTAIYNRIISDTSKKFAERIIIDPFEILSLPIEGYERLIGSADIMDRTKVISVIAKDQIIKIPLIRACKKWSRYMLGLLDEKIIESFTFKAVYDLDDKKYKCATIL